MDAGGQQGSQGGVHPKEPTALEEGRAFVQEIEVDPIGSGPLDGLSFAIKDLIDIGGYKTGCGNPCAAVLQFANTGNLLSAQGALKHGGVKVP